MKYILTTAIVCLALSAIFVPEVFAQQPAQTDYNLLAPLPLNGPGAGDTRTTNASTYIQGMFTLIIALAGVLAVVMIIFGGIKYMSTDAFGEKSEAKNTIQNAIVGLLLAIGSWLILFTINPNLVRFNLNIDRQTIPYTPQTGATGGGGGGGGRILPGYPLTDAQVAQDNTIRANLPQNVTVNSPVCANGGISGCTNLVGLPPNAIAGVTGLAANCNCAVIISGGSEGGHQTHGPNIPNLDIRRGSSAALDSYITGGQPTTASCGVSSAPKYVRNGAIYTNEGDHWHACY